MTDSITVASEYILQLLKDFQQGSVHSVYRKTINLTFGKQLVAIQAAASPLSPISLITTLTAQEMESLPVHVNDRVTLIGNVLEIGQHCRFSTRTTASQNTEFAPTLSDDALFKLKQDILSVLSDKDKGSFELLFSHPEKADEILFLSAAKKHLLFASEALAVSDWGTAAQTLCKLIGLGLGLTPGGDDFLCGVLAGLLLCKQSNHPFSLILHQTIGELLLNTNAISGAFLQCALNNQFSMAVCSLGTSPSVAEMISSFSAIGHSSGTDTLCGIEYILQNNELLT